jgi:hypothetical protein
MAKQMGHIPLKGTIGDVTYYFHPDDGYLARAKTDIDKKDIQKKPSYAYFRDCGKEFSDAIYAGQLMRHSINHILSPIADGKLSSRMNKALLQVIQSDPVNRPAERKLEMGQLLTLLGFEFNNKQAFADTFKGDFMVMRNKTTNELYINIPGFKVADMIKAPEYATHFQFVVARAVINFTEERYKNAIGETISIPLDQPFTENLHFVLPAEAIAGGIDFLLLGIRFSGKLDNIPKDATSQRKRKKLKRRKNADGTVDFTGALKIIRVVP